MKKDELIELAALGVPHKVREMERQLAAMWKLFPDIFLSASAPQLLRPEVRANGNGHWPAISISAPDEEAAPKRKGGRKKGVKTGTGIDLDAYQKLYDYVEQHPGCSQSEVAAAIGVHPANVRGKLERGLDRGFFTKKGGGYTAKKAPVPQEA